MLPVNIRFVLPPPPGDQRAVCTGRAAERISLSASWHSCITHVTVPFSDLFVPLWTNVWSGPKFSVFFLTRLPFVSLPSERCAMFGMVLSSLDTIILVTPIWKIFVCTLAPTDAQSPAWDAKVDKLAGTCTQLEVSMMLLHFAHAQILI